MRTRRPDAVLAVVLASGAWAAEPVITVHVDRTAGRASPLLYGCSLPAPGTPGGQAILAELVANRSFESPPPGKPLPIPKEWGEGTGWTLLSCGSKRLIVRRNAEGGEPLTLARRARWRDYKLTVFARKIDGPGGLVVLVEVESAQTHLRWTLGGKGNRYHVLERVHRGEAREITPAVVGRIEAARCYKIEVEVRDRTVRCSLDGRPIHRVDKATLRYAGVGLGARGATAEYFDVRVHTPKRRPLFLLNHPAEGRRATVAAGWERCCDPRNTIAYRWDTLYPANSYFSQRIEVTQYGGGDAGILQRGLPIEAGARYRCALHLRADEPVGAVVSLRSRGGKVLASHRVDGLSRPWKRYEFVLRPAGSDRAACLCVSLTGLGRAWVDQISLRRIDDETPYGLRKDVVAALRALRPAVVRWPAGPGAMHYNWQRGIGPRDERAVASVADGAASRFEAALSDFGPDEFLRLCRDLGAEPILVLNATLGMRPALYWLEYCNGPLTSLHGARRARNGHREPYRVRYWAIDESARDQMSATQYAQTVGQIAKAMREQDPSVRVLALGGPSLAYGPLDGKLVAEAGSSLSHLARSARLAASGGDAVASLGELAAALRALRARKLPVALTDWSPAPGPPGLALVASRTLGILARDGGPQTIATATAVAADATRPARGELLAALPAAVGLSPAYHVLKLLRACPVGDLAAVEVQPPPEAKHGIYAVAGRDGERLVLWLTHAGAEETSTAITIRGLGGRRLAAHAQIFCINATPGADATPRERRVDLAGDRLALTMAPQSVYAVIVPFERR